MNRTNKNANKSEHHKPATLRLLLVFLLAMAGILLLAVAAKLCLANYRTSQEKKLELERLAVEEYNAVFLSMFSIDNYQQEDFATYRGIDTLKINAVAKNTNAVAEYMEAALGSDNDITNIYLGLDPSVIWSRSHKKVSRWDENINTHILSYISAHPNITFEILLPNPRLEYWTELSERAAEETLTTYSTLISTLSAQPNVTLYFMGMEQWLIANPANYVDNMTTNEIISQKIFLFTFCDHEYQINSVNSEILLSSLKNLIVSERSAPTKYPDFSHWDIVFFGDSIIGNYTGSYSVPGVVSALSHARTYNCANGGIPACVDPAAPLSFPASVEYFANQDFTSIPEGSPFVEAMTQYIQSDHTDRRLCFVLNYGLNDYFGGHPIDNTENSTDTSTYAGALRTGIDKIREYYPDSIILLITPNYITEYSNGTVRMNENSGILTDYVDAAIKVAQEKNVICLNNYSDSGINESTASMYLADGTHLGEAGRFLMAEKILEWLDKNTR